MAAVRFTDEEAEAQQLLPGPSSPWAGREFGFQAFLTVLSFLETEGKESSVLPFYHERGAREGSG